MIELEMATRKSYACCGLLIQSREFDPPKEEWRPRSINRRNFPVLMRRNENLSLGQITSRAMIQIGDELAIIYPRRLEATPYEEGLPSGKRQSFDRFCYYKNDLLSLNESIVTPTSMSWNRPRDIPVGGLFVLNPYQFHVKFDPEFEEVIFAWFNPNTRNKLWLLRRLK